MITNRIDVYRFGDLIAVNLLGPASPTATVYFDAKTAEEVAAAIYAVVKDTETVPFTQSTLKTTEVGADVHA